MPESRLQRTRAAYLESDCLEVDESGRIVERVAQTFDSGDVDRLFVRGERYFERVDAYLRKHGLAYEAKPDD